MNSRITVRAMVYRGDPGFSIGGTDDRGRHLRMFVPARWQADAIKRTLKTGGSEEAISAIMRAQP